MATALKTAPLPYPPIADRAPFATLPFFLAAYAITWLAQLPAVLAKLGVIAGPFERFMPLVGLGALGPLLAAVLVARFEPNGAGVRALFRPMRTWRVGLGWYLVALGLPAATFLVGRFAYGLFSGDGAQAPDLHWLYPPENAQRIAALILFPIGEEVGWRGFALPRLQRRFSPLAASQVLGVAWAFWHVPMFLLAGMGPEVFAISLVYLMAGSVTTSWIYNHTRASLLLAILAHAGAHLNNVNQALPGNLTPLGVQTVALSVFAVALVVAQRKVWLARPQ